MSESLEKSPVNALENILPDCCCNFSPYTKFLPTFDEDGKIDQVGKQLDEHRYHNHKYFSESLENARKRTLEGDVLTGKQVELPKMTFWLNFIGAALCGANYAFISAGAPLSIPKIALEKSAVIAAALLNTMFSLALALSVNVWMAIAFRGMMGGAGMGLLVFSPLLVAELVPIEARGTWQGIAGVISGTFGMISPVICGTFADMGLTGWRFIYYFIMALCFFVAMWFLVLFKEQRKPLTINIDKMEPKSKDFAPKRVETLQKQVDVTSVPVMNKFMAILSSIDLIGSILWFIGIFCVLLGVNLGGGLYKNFALPVVIALICVGVVIVIAFFIYEGKWAKNPLIPLHFFLNRNFGLIGVYSVLVGMISAGYLYVFPTWAQTVWGVNGTITGTWTIPGSILAMVFSVAIGIIIQKTKRTREWIWLATLVFGILCTLLPVFATRETGYWLPILSNCFYGMTFGVLNIVPVVMAQLAVAPHMIATATSVRVSLFLIGGTLGITYMGLVPVVVTRSYVQESLDATLSLWPTDLRLQCEALFNSQSLQACINQVAKPNNLVTDDLLKLNQQGIEYGFKIMWIISTCVMGLAFLISLGLKHQPLIKQERMARQARTVMHV